MLEKRGFSKKINYRLLESLYGDEAAEDKDKDKPALETESTTLRRSRSHSVLSRRSASVEPEAARRAAAAAAPLPAKQPPSTTTAAAPKEQILGPAPAPSQTKPTDPTDPPRLGHDPSAYSDEEDDDEVDDEMDEEEDEMDADDPDGIEAAFAGRYQDYYDEGSEYGSD
ncbi:hypothetical protein VTN02DRAFT_1367 [Thermoascus thermophilus]